MRWAGERNKMSDKFAEDIIFDHDEDIHGHHRFEVPDEWLGERRNNRTKNDPLAGMFKDKEDKYNYLKDKMRPADWERRFDQLMAENLIKTDKAFFEDKVPFDRPEKLEEIFTELEEKNLKMIHSLQEKQQILEQMKD